MLEESYISVTPLGIRGLFYGDQYLLLVTICFDNKFKMVEMHEKVLHMEIYTNGIIIPENQN
jgi:hypothetical protein